MNDEYNYNEIEQNDCCISDFEQYIINLMWIWILVFYYYIIM